MTTRRPTRTDEGAALVLALIVITVFALVAGAILAFAGTSFRRTVVVKDRIEKVAAANAGVRYALEQLQFRPTFCASGLAAGGTGETVRLPPLVEGRSVDLTCRWLAGQTLGVGGYAMALTGENLGGNPILSTQGGSSPKPVLGPVYLARTQPSLFDLKKVLAVSEGDVEYHEPGCDDPVTLPADLRIDSFGRLKMCNPRTWQQAVKLPTLPATPPPAPAPPVTPKPNCKVFFPGTYTSMNLGSGDVYLASGVYYLNNLGTLTINGHLKGGQPGPTDAEKLTDYNANCTGVNDEHPQVAGTPGVGGTGVTLVLGGNTRIVVDKGSLELFRRTPGPLDPFTDLTNVAVFAVPPGTPGWNAHAVGPNVAVLATDPGNKKDMVIHGASVTPYAAVEFGNITGKSTYGQFLGGLVASRAVLQSSQSPPPGNFLLATDVGPFARDLILESTALGTRGDAPVTATVVLQVSNETGRPIGVRSWRVG